MNDNARIRGFDFHCHVDLQRDPARLVAQCERERIFTIAVTTTPKAWSHNRQWTQHSGYVHAAVGLHPELVGERFREADLLADLIPAARFIGEVGLDGSPQHKSSFAQQKEVFGRVLRAAQAQGGRVVTVHSRRAADDVIEMVKTHTSSDRVLTILHWFTGTKEAAKAAAEAGCYFSINAAMLGNDKGRALVRSLPKSRLLTETDSPFTSVGTRKAVPWDVIETRDRLALELGMIRDEMQALLHDNSKRVLRFGGVVIGR